MGIIGVVAALTLPNLNSSTGDKEKVAKVKKIYSNLQDAYGRATAVYGPFDDWFINDGNDNDKKTKRMFDRITEFMKYSKVCTVSDSCTLFDANSESSGIRANYSVILADGSVVGFSYMQHNTYRKIFVDIDGMNKGANLACKDFFTFIIDDNGILKYSVGGSTYAEHEDSALCASWVMRNDNMDYLKTGSDYKCPDGKTVLDGVTNTTCK